MTPLVENGASIEEVLNNIVGSIGEQNEQISIRMGELERAVHVERESLREEINRNRQEVGRSEKRLTERTDEHLAKNLSRMTREAKQRELRLRDDMEKLRTKQEQTLGTLDTKIDAMMQRRTQAIMDKLDGLLGSRSGQREGEPNSGGPSREPRVNFDDHQRRRTFGSTRGRGSSAGYIDTWIEVMKLHFGEEDLSESALTSNLEGTALSCVMAKKQYQRDTAEKIFEILLNHFGSGVQGHQAMMRFEKRRQREDETIEMFLDNLEMLRRRSQPDESNRRMNLAVALKFIDGVKNDELRTMLATHYTPLSTKAPTPEELRLKSKEYLLLNPPSRSGYYKNNYGNFNNGPANQGNNW